MRLLGPCGFLVALLAAACASRSDPGPDPTLVVPHREIHPVNAALHAYLGEPVNWPAEVDPAFSVQGLRRAFEEACDRVCVSLRRFEVDYSEFPPVVGVEVVSADAEFSVDALGGALPDPYEGSGCTSSGHDEGGVLVRTIVTDVVPWDAVPSNDLDRAMRRRGVRTQRLLQAMQSTAVRGSAAGR